jgi:hypothetical protein
MRRLVLLAVFVSIGSCKRRECAPTPPPAASVVRGAAGDEDLRAMLTELASAKACQLIRGGFKPIQSADNPAVATGVLWIRGCQVSSDGTRVTFHLTGNGWQWQHERKVQAGGTFEVRQYVRFTVDTRIQGAFDVAYDRTSHVASVWFTPARIPDVGFQPIGEVEVDEKGTWSSIIGSLAGTFAESPEESATAQAKSRGTGQFQQQLSAGLAATINLCTGLTRFNLGRPPKGEMQPPSVGETKSRPVEVHPGGVLIAGPQDASHGMTIDAEVARGAVRINLVCASEAERIADTIVAGRVPGPGPVLAGADVRRRATLRLRRARCPVMVVASPLGNTPARFSWQRPARQIARASGGSIIDCGRSGAAPAAR